MSNQNECEFSGVIVSTGDLSLEERVTALEKQLTDMQAAMSCSVLNEADITFANSLRDSTDKIEESLHQSIKKTKG